jgi:hypothetical protein
MTYTHPSLYISSWAMTYTHPSLYISSWAMTYTHPSLYISSWAITYTHPSLYISSWANARQRIYRCLAFAPFLLARIMPYLHGSSTLLIIIVRILIIITLKQPSWCVCI